MELRPRGGGVNRTPEALLSLVLSTSLLASIELDIVACLLDPTTPHTCQVDAYKRLGSRGPCT